VCEAKHLINIGCDPGKRTLSGLRTIGALVCLHLEDLQQVGRPICRSKMAVMEALKRNLRAVCIVRLVVLV